MKIPVLSTRITGIPELIEHGTDGLLATPGDVDDLVEQLSRLLQDSQLRCRLGDSGRNKVVTTYNQQQNNGELAAIFTQIGEEDVCI